MASNHSSTHSPAHSPAQAAAEKANAPRLALSPDACLLRHVARTSRAVVAAYDPALAPFGLTGHQFNLMMTLRNMGPLTVGGLAEALGMDPSGVPRAIRPLVEAGAIAAKAGEDRRQRVLSLTPAGRAALEGATPAWEKVQVELVGLIGAERWMALTAELRAVRQAASTCSTRKPA